MAKIKRDTFERKCVNLGVQSNACILALIDGLGWGGPTELLIDLCDAFLSRNGWTTPDEIKKYSAQELRSFLTVFKTENNSLDASKPVIKLPVAEVEKKTEKKSKENDSPLKTSVVEAVEVAAEKKPATAEANPHVSSESPSRALATEMFLSGDPSKITLATALLATKDQDIIDTAQDYLIETEQRKKDRILRTLQQMLAVTSKPPAGPVSSDGEEDDDQPGLDSDMLKGMMNF